MALLSELGWATVNARDEILGADGTLGRETTSEVVLAPRLRAGLERLNPDILPEGITAAVDQLMADRSAMSLAAAAREIYLLLKEGVRVSIPDREHGGQREARVSVIDWRLSVSRNNRKELFDSNYSLRRRRCAD